MRHFISRVYDGVDHEIAWDTIEREIPELSERLKTLLDRHR